MTLHHVVVVGAGFGGLEFVHAMAGASVRITLIDRRNHHLFQPLLYQVATTSLGTAEIAWPVRHLLRRRQERRCDLVEQRLEQMMVALVDQRDPHRQLGRSTGEFEPAETAADNDNVWN